ncbi:MAG TPA: phage tail length tape measure family protein [Anaerolineae bacterium]|nr:phage tail length tape measure family protein [Anaerolineae bacterium]HUW95982.1 phage tail length tape measure family protein [Anaerolineae bacterium]
MANEVTIHIKGKDDASKVIGGVEKKAGGLGAALKNVTQIAGGFLAAQMMTSGVQKLTGFLSDCTAKAKEQAAVEAQLDAVLKSTGGAAGVTADEIKDLASELQKTTNYGDEATISAANMLMTFTAIGKEVLPDTIKAVQDMATAMGTDLKQQSIMVGKALQDPVLGCTALQKVGVRLTESQKALVKSLVDVGDVAGAQKVILAELTKEYGGSAEAAVAADGGMTQMSNKMGDMQEQIGTALLPAMVKWKEAQLFVLSSAMKLGPVLKSFADEWLPRLQVGIDLVKEALSKVGEAVSPIIDKLKLLGDELTESGAISAAAAAIIGTALVAAFIALTVAAGTAAVAVIAATWPFIAVGAAIAGVTAAIVLAVKHWDDITAAIGRARDWFLSLPAPIKVVAVVLGAPLIPIIALGVGIHRLATNWGSAWQIIRSATETVVNFIIGMIATLMGAIAAVLSGLASVAEAIPGWIPGAEKVAGALRGIADEAANAAAMLNEFNFNLTGAANAANAFQAVSSVASGVATGLRGAIQAVAGAAGKLYTEAKALVPVLGPGPGGVGGAADGAAGGLGGAASAADDARGSFVALLGATNLLNVMNYQATITELKLSDAMQQVFGIGADLVPLWETQIGLLEEQRDALRGTGEANDILAEAIDGTIQGLRDQIEAAGDAQDALVLMGTDAVGPVAQMFQDMVENIDKATDSIKGLLGITTEEEAQRNLGIATLDLEIAKIDQLAGVKRGLTDLDEMAIKHWEKLILIRKEELDSIEEGQEGEREAIEASIEELEGKIESLKALGDTETAAGKAAREHMEDLLAQKDVLVDQGEEWDATTKYLGAFMDAQVEGRPTMDTLTGMVFAQGKQLGLWQGDVEELSPALREWYRTHSQTVFDIMLNFNHLLLNQQGFVTGSGTLADQWAQLWIDAAAAVATALAGVGGGDVDTGEVAVGAVPMQHGGIVTRPTLALLGERGPEAVIPLGHGITPGGDTYINEIHMHVQGSILSERDVEKVMGDALRHGKFRGTGGLA